MAEFEITVPNKNLPDVLSTEQVAIGNTLSGLRKNYGKIIDEVATNSNIPAELLYSFITFLSNGVNNAPFKTSDDLIRSGLFSLSNRVGKGILATEMKMGRMNSAEKSFLENSGDATLKDYLKDDKGTLGFAEHWNADFNAGVEKISDTKKPINWQNPRIAIQTGAIWIGQVWDEFSKQTKSPLDKVIVTIFLPYGSYSQPGTKSFILTNKGFLNGSNFAKGRPWNIDYTMTGKSDSAWLPGNTQAISPGVQIPKGSAHIINPKGGYVGNVLRYIMARHGALNQLIV